MKSDLDLNNRPTTVFFIFFEPYRPVFSAGFPCFLHDRRPGFLEDFTNQNRFQHRFINTENNIGFNIL